MWTAFSEQQHDCRTAIVCCQCSDSITLQQAGLFAAGAAGGSQSEVVADCSQTITAWCAATILLLVVCILVQRCWQLC